MLALAHWRDAGLILLAFEAFVMGLGLGAILYVSLRGLRQAQAWLLPRLRVGRGYVRQARHIVARVMAAVVMPFVLMQSAVAGLRQALQLLSGR
jgi:hypothetical protein